MKLDLINNVNDREIVMRKENKPKLLDLLRRFGSVVDYMTELMVARFFGVEVKTIHNYGDRNSDELRRYGYRVYRKSECQQILKPHLEVLETIPNRGLRLYPMEAVAVIGMMLTESKVAEQLRSEIISELFGVSVDKEKQLAQELGVAIANGDMNEVLRINTELFALKNKKIILLEGEIKDREEIINDLLYNVDLAEKRQRVNQIVKYGNEDVVSRWRLLYGEFNLKHHKDVYRCAKNRGITVIEYIDQIGMMEGLYELAVKLFRTDVDALLDYWKCTIESSRKGR